MYKDIENGFSIQIPTFNSLEYLKACIESIQEHTKLPYEIVVHSNDGSDGTNKYLELLDNKIVKFSRSERNIGVCGAMNATRRLASKKLLMYLNDDMIVLPGWDTAFKDYITKNELDKLSWLSGTLIEPIGNPEFQLAPVDYGRTPGQFQKQRLLNDLEKLRRKRNCYGANWPPTLLHVDVWDEIGGYSEEFFPGTSSDADLAKKVYDLGCRTFIGLGEALVYHFVSITRRKVADTRPGKEIFKAKYGYYPNKFFNELGVKWI